MVHALQEAYEASGFPRGLFANLNTDNDTVARVIEDPRIAAVTVTGSVRAGSAVAVTAARAIKKSVLELGGADPFIVLTDADLDGAVRAAVQSRCENAGQVCLAAKRIILERPIAEAFTRAFVEAAAALRVGDPMDEATFVGPIARADLRDGIHDQVERSIAKGARLLLGGYKVDGPGYFYEPTVLADVGPGMAAFDEEIFGPVAAITVAEDLEDAIRLANASEYGLSANIWTADVEKARAVASRVLGKLFRRLFLEGLIALHEAGRLAVFGGLAHLADRRAFLRYLAPVRTTRWVVYAKPPFAGPAAVLAYLSRYTHRVAIANRRLVAFDGTGVTFRYKDYRRDGADRQKVMTLAADEFIRRFLLHVLPKGFHRIRHYGLLASAARKANLARARDLLAVPPSTETEAAERPSAWRPACPCCGGRMIIIAAIPSPAQPRAPPTAPRSSAMRAS